MHGTGSGPAGLAAVLAITFSAPDSSAQLIDDFEAGPFSFGCTSPAYCQATQSIGSHGMAPARTVLVWSDVAGTSLTADLATTTYVTLWDLRMGRSELALWDGTTTFITWCARCAIQDLE